ncbi:hypothetical protein BDV06DRAFT_195613 [Aspergillus oleicola]
MACSSPGSSRDQSSLFIVDLLLLFLLICLFCATATNGAACWMIGAGIVVLVLVSCLGIRVFGKEELAARFCLRLRPSVFESDMVAFLPWDLSIFL